MAQQQVCQKSKWHSSKCAKNRNGTAAGVPKPIRFKGENVSRAISLDAAIIVTEISKRTLWRRLSDGQITRQDNDKRGRTMLTFKDIVPMLCASVSPEDYELFTDADAGDADAQNDLAQLFLEADKADIALHWFQLAVAQEHPDAMHNLAKLHIKGIGVPKDKSISLMWLAKAASFGHVIASQQLVALTRFVKA